MGENNLYLFEKQVGEIEFIPTIEFESTGRNSFRMKYNRPAVLVLRKLVSFISRLLLIDDNGGNEDDDESRGKNLYAGINDYLRMTPTNRKRKEHLKLFFWYMIPDYMVYLYRSPIRNNKQIAEESMGLFLYSNIQTFPIHIQHQFCRVVLMFCKLLRDETTTSGRLLYYSFRQTYVTLFHSIECGTTPRIYPKPRAVILDLHPFMIELTKQLLVNMKLIRQSCFCRVPSELKLRFQRDVGEFSIFTLHICRKIKEHMRLHHQSLDSRVEYLLSGCDMIRFYSDFNELLNNIDLGLTYVDDGVECTRCTECEFNHGWSYYLLILRELDIISKLYHPARKNFSSCLNSHHVSINKLIMRSKRGDDHQWLLKHENLISNESRRHLIKMMFPDQLNDDCHLQKMKVIIDRSKLLVDSFEHVGLANPSLLRSGIVPHFKNEEVVVESGVFGEWLLLVCQDLFNPQNLLFLSCLHDQHRLFPNTAKVDPQQLDYYKLCGRVIALALMHDVQIGIGFDRLFFMQLAGSLITLEDIRNVDPSIYKSCRDILEMDTEFVDSDGLGLTFVWETEEKDESGSGRKIVELCPGGRTIVVNSVNREEYIELVIQHCFIKSVEEKVKLFIQGLDDVLTRKLRKIFFQSIELEDLDHMLLERKSCERNQEEDRNCYEVDSSTTTPFQRIIETTLPLSRLKYFHRPLTCKLQSRSFLFC